MYNLNDSISSRWQITEQSLHYYITSDRLRQIIQRINNRECSVLLLLLILLIIHIYKTTHQFKKTWRIGQRQAQSYVVALFLRRLQLLSPLQFLPTFGQKPQINPPDLTTKQHLIILILFSQLLSIYPCIYI